LWYLSVVITKCNTSKNKKAREIPFAVKPIRILSAFITTSKEERRMKFHDRILLLALLIITTTACAGPAATATPDWQTYTNSQAGFSIQYPSTWKMETLPDQNSGALHGISLKGTEGGVELHWGVGLGGGCSPEGLQMIKVAQGELQACHGKAEDGTERWQDISKALPTTGFAAYAYTSDTAPASHDLVLKVLSTLSFP
jgi:hypothetical protein